MKNEYNVRQDLSLVLLENDYAVEDVAASVGVSRRTIFNVLSGSIIPNEDTLEKIYSFMYKDGYRLNQIKESLFKDIGEFILFHGAKNQIKEITVDGSRSTCDFGKGFYLGETFNQAANFVCEYIQSSVYAFWLKPNNLKIREFKCELDWMIAICYYRGTIEKYKKHPKIKEIINSIETSDVIIAPIANNRMFYVMQLFADGEITTEQAYHSLSASSLGKQYVLKSQKAIEQLIPLERLYLCSEEKEQYLKGYIAHGEKIDEELKEAKRKYRREGLFIDELFK